MTPLRLARTALTAVALAGIVGWGISGFPAPSASPAVAAPAAVSSSSPAASALAKLPVKGSAAMTGYSRDRFGQAWSDVDRNGCDTRNDILKRDLTGETFRAGTRGCIVLTGTLRDPYTAKTIHFVRGQRTSLAVQIDHVVALGNAWRQGAQQWPASKRLAFANDPLNLLAVDGPTNGRKGASNAASWLPPNKAYRCSYVARQVAVKAKYQLSVTAAEKAAIGRVLATCPRQALPR